MRSMRPGLQGGAFAQQLINLRHFRPLACTANCAQAGATEHVFKVSPTDLANKGKLRLDAYLAGKLPQTSRARLQASIKEGLVSVNGAPQGKSSYVVRPGDTVGCSVLPPPPLEAAPEALPLNIVYEDEHLIVINKAADLVMHPSPGHYTGTLVNALLHHCGLPAMRLSAAEGEAVPLSLSVGDSGALAGGPGALGGSTEAEEGSEDELLGDYDDDDSGLLLAPLLPPSPLAPALTPVGGPTGAARQQQALAAAVGSGGGGGSGAASTIRPGIVHRLDKGTTGLLVVAKDDPTHLSLATQFKDRTVQRTYWAITVGVPSPAEGRVATNVGRDFRDRKKMAAFAYASTRGRTAASNYSVIRPLAAGGAALVQWRLETGRTHQIRVHSRHLGHPLFGDSTYGGGTAATAAAIAARSRGGAAASAAAQRIAAALNRPALHAKTLGFMHPATGQRMQFDSELPADFQAALDAMCQPPF